MIEIYTDGACSGNPGPGGYGFYIKPYDVYGKGGERSTTNNRMELLAAIKALEYVLKDWGVPENEKVILYSDSKYLCDAHNAGWINNWIRNGFRKSGGGRVQNMDLWNRLLHVEHGLDISYVWVKGHAGHPENEMCDHLAVRACEEAMK